MDIMAVSLRAPNACFLAAIPSTRSTLLSVSSTSTFGKQLCFRYVGFKFVADIFPAFAVIVMGPPLAVVKEEVLVRLQIQFTIAGNTHGSPAIASFPDHV